MKGRLKLALRATAVVGALVVGAVAFSSVDLVQVGRTLSSLGVFAPLVLVPFGLSMLCDTYALRTLLAKLGSSVTVRPLFSIRMAAEAFIVSLSGGAFVAEGVAPVLLDKRCKTPLSIGIASSSLRKGLLLNTQGVFLAGGAVAGFVLIEDPTLPTVGAVAALALFVVGALLLGVLTGGELSQRSLKALRWVTRRSRWIDTKLSKLESGATHTDRALSEVERRDLFVPAFWIFALWMLEAFETWLILRLLGADIGFFAVWAFEPALSLLRHLLFFLPAGLGVQDAGYVVFLRALGVEDPLTLGAAFAIVKRAKELVWALLGFIALAHLSGSGPADERAEEVLT